MSTRVRSPHRGAASSLQTEAAMAAGAFDWSERAASTLARAAWIARCARRIAELVQDVDLEQARAVAEAVADDAHLRGLEPELAAGRLLHGR